MQKGVIPIPKSSNENRIKENIDIFDFELSSEDMKAIDSLDKGDDMSVTPPLNTIVWISKIKYNALKSVY